MKRLVLLTLLSLIPLPLLANDPDSCLDLGAKEQTAYVVTDGDSNTSCGDFAEIRIAQESRNQGEEVVWFRIDDQTWVIRDPAVTAEARRLFSGVNEIARQQGAIGARQGRLGAEQGRIGAKQAAAALSGQPTRDESARMRELGDQMAVLGREQSKYGDQMQAEVAQAQRHLSALLGRAMKDGTAVRVRRV